MTYDGRVGRAAWVACSIVATLATARADSNKPSKRPLVGKITLASGGVVVVTGLVLGGVALHHWHDAQTTALTDPAAANQQVHTTRILGDVSTVMVIVGVATAATGLYLWRSHGATIAPRVGADGGGVALSGTF